MKTKLLNAACYLPIGWIAAFIIARNDCREHLNQALVIYAGLLLATIMPIKMIQALGYLVFGACIYIGIFTALVGSHWKIPYLCQITFPFLKGGDDETL